MAICMNDTNDPVQKLKELHDWLMSNKVATKFPQPEKPLVKPAPDTKYGIKAEAEAEDFRSWIHSIQSPGRVF